jgi:O-Antigen ligase
VDSTLKRRTIASCAVGGSLLIGWQIGNGSILLAAVLAAFFVLLGIGWMTGLAPDAAIGGAVLVGYLVGNRGFAQLNVPHLPLLPAELVLGIAIPCSLWRAVRSKVLPFRLDCLNYALILFLIAGAIRIPIDIRRYGVMALRDFATVYYVLFFFLAQDWARDRRAMRWIERCFSVGFALVLPAFAAFQLWPDFITDHLSINGVPLVYAKSDIACGFMAAGLFWFLDAYSRKHRLIDLLLAASNFAGVLLSNSRAALVGLAVCLVWLAVEWAVYRSGRILRYIVLICAFGCLALAGESLLPRKAGESSQLYTLYERALTIADFSGTYVPDVSMLSDKADNNTFRVVWWKAVIGETLDGGPWFGMGFGHDLAERFAAIYYPDETEDFSIRSPHCVLITIFARMGFVGLAIAVAIMVAIAIRTQRDAKYSVGHQIYPAWLGCWAIFLTSCFGVVLEGPMGAVAFWILLGLANSKLYQTEEMAALSAAADSEPAVTGLQNLPAGHSPVAKVGAFDIQSGNP